MLEINFTHSFFPRQNCQYTMEQGYGFAMSTEASINEDLRDSWPGEYFTPAIPTFLIDVPHGNYIITVTVRSHFRDSTIMVKEGLGHVKVYREKVYAGETVKKEFSVHVDDGQIKLAFWGEALDIHQIDVTRSAMIPTIYLVGDSTVTDQASGKYPYSGWGQMIGFFIGKSVAISNHARSGRSSKSFINEGRLNQIAKMMRKRDYLFLQFAHNDEKDNEGGTDAFSTYQDYLNRYISLARSKKAVPVLISPMHRRFFQKDGTIENTHGDYIKSMQQLSVRENVPYIDLATLSKEYFEKLGSERTKDIFFWAKPGQYKNHPEGAEDNTHFTEYGAMEVAKLVARRIEELDLL
ncbi:Lysophospholipase L1 [Gracilibacillus ureilyticus]|uniref:Lysophospholipase L1 n=1 Tax=Gracilibacillus ureilyticus TaxID=531814 RepID=A0A1H9N030_9BACI|nr:rhamnogalacturonan acetylesterase [Gracilibacillus ureilyticus]SER29336.1 Lysophospholipase L1 [Gracilibacillus ureilyticus]